jgi:GntR family transcriptional regulator, transcriptional repressor for pyruvate dehydrogenase complex
MRACYFKKIRDNKRLSENIANQIKKAIFEQKLKPGDKLPPEIELSKIFGTSRTTTREALRFLEVSGLLTVKAGQDGGAFVTQPDISHFQRMILDLITAQKLTVEHFTDARMILEPNIIERVIQKITKEKMGILEQNVNMAEAEIKKGKPRNVSINVNFHKILVECTENPLLILMLNIILDSLTTYLRAKNPRRKYADDVVVSHKEILKRLKGGRVELARKAMIDHINQVNMILHKVD